MIAICTMLRKPFNFDTWLDYHLSLGIDYIYLRVEETPYISELLEKYKDKVIVEYDDLVDKSDNYWTQMDRQKEFVNNVIKDCLSKSIEWLAHIDSDELLWFSKPIKDILSNIDKKFSFITLKNYEAVYPNDSLNNPFLETNNFRYKGHLAYGNGKSIGRVSENLKYNGPHLFSGSQYEISPILSIVLHFESPTFEHWYKKFYEEKMNISDDLLEKIPFKFYKESISIIRKGNLEKCREYYNKMKVETYNGDNITRLFWTPMLEEKNSNWSR